jgi:hypothetical protein
MADALMLTVGGALSAGETSCRFGAQVDHVLGARCGDRFLSFERADRSRGRGGYLANRSTADDDRPLQATVACSSRRGARLHGAITAAGIRRPCTRANLNDSGLRSRPARSYPRSVAAAPDATASLTAPDDQIRTAARAASPARDPARCKGLFLTEIFTIPSRQFHTSCSVRLLD